MINLFLLNKRQISTVLLGTTNHWPPLPCWAIRFSRCKMCLAAIWNIFLSPTSYNCSPLMRYYNCVMALDVNQGWGLKIATKWIILVGNVDESVSVDSASLGNSYYRLVKSGSLTNNVFIRENFIVRDCGKPSVPIWTKVAPCSIALISISVESISSSSSEVKVTQMKWFSNSFHD